MSQKVIIIGAKGMLGKDLISLYKEAGYDAKAWDISEIDITNREVVLAKISSADPDYVINAAAYNAVDKAEEPEGFRIALKVNSEGPKNLAEACKKVGAVFATYSSDYVFAGTKKEGYREDETPSPISKYGESKFQGEKNVEGVGGDYYIIRTSKLFGREGEGENAKKSFMTVMREIADSPNTPKVNGVPQLKVVNEELSCFTYTPDLAAVTRFLLEGNYPPGIYHIVNEGPCTWYECAKTLFKILKKKVKLIPVRSSEFPRPAKRPKYSVLLNTKLPRLRSYENALRDYLGKGIK